MLKTELPNLDPKKNDGRGGQRRSGDARRGDPRRSDQRRDGRKGDNKEDQFIEKLVSVRRVTKVVKGGKNMRFSALVVVGDGRGRAGYATGKAREVPEAVKKASERAKKSMIRVPLKEGRTLHHDVHVKVGAGIVNLRTAPAGTGVIAGGPMRAVFEALGVQDVVSKSIGSSNYHTVVHATFDALEQISSPRSIAMKLSKPLSDITARRINAFKKKRPVLKANETEGEVMTPLLQTQAQEKAKDLKKTPLKKKFTKVAQKPIVKKSSGKAIVRLPGQALDLKNIPSSIDRPKRGEKKNDKKFGKFRPDLSIKELHSKKGHLDLAGIDLQAKPQEKPERHSVEQRKPEPKTD
jgi:small subunit ribosomal protein S5